MRAGLSRLKVAHKLALAASLFSLPVGYIVWSLVAEQDIAVRFAAQEVYGARYLADLTDVQRAAAGLSLAGATAATDALTASLGKLEEADGAALDTATQAQAVLAALKAPAGLDDGRAKLRDLISRIGDRSNLILDNVLDTYYLTDVVLNRLPDIVDHIVDLPRSQGVTDVDARAQFLVGLGTLVADLDGMEASLTSAEQAPGGDAIRSALDADYKPLHAALGSLVDELKSGHAQPTEIDDLLKRASAFTRRATEKLGDLLAERVADLHFQQVRILAVTALLFAAAIATMVLVTRLCVTSPLRRLSAANLRLAAGDLECELPRIASADELGAMARAMREFREQAIERQRLEKAADDAREVRTRQQQVMERHTQDFGTSIAGVLGSLGASAGAMRAAADTMGSAVERTRAGSAATAGYADSSSSNLSAVAAATEQLSASTDEIARQVAQAAQSARGAVERSKATGTTVGSLSEAAGKIEAVLALIADIAGKTNLLALNATIEAARAGDAGKGFAVVASEVKQLAAQTAKATEEIRIQIASLQSVTRQAVAAVHEVGNSIVHMDGITSAIAAAVEEQGAATREIASSIGVVSGQNQDTTEAMRGVSEAAESASGLGQQVQRAADDLARVSSTLQQEVNHFLTAVRTDGADRRRWERVACKAAPAALRCAGREEAAALSDISRGGARLDSAIKAAPGTEIELALPQERLAVGGRVVRADGGTVAIAFRQDPASLSRIDEMMEAVGAAQRKAGPVAAAQARRS